MTEDQDHPELPSPWVNHKDSLSPFSQTYRDEVFDSQPTHSGRNAHFMSSPSVSHLPERQSILTRAATLKYEPHRTNAGNSYIPQARSEDLNHSSNAVHQFMAYTGTSHEATLSSLSPTPSSRPATPGKLFRYREQSPCQYDGIDMLEPSCSSHSDDSLGKQVPAVAVASTIPVLTNCFACGKAMQGPFVRALGAVYHLNCFECMDCGDVVASKFFPIDGPDGKQHPLCERDYFRRLNLICAKCSMALRGSYITACNKKYHVEHFTCSLCSTLFGPQDSYYEHESDVYCHFHYSTRFATKCAGCSTAILKQFVEINRNMRDECWHPECYMINKFWNVRVVSRRPTSCSSLEDQPDVPSYVGEEQRETPISLKEKQVRMEQQVYRIWTVLSAFEESSAACISDMLRQVSNGQYLDAIRMAEKFILHVEVLFGSIDDLEYHFSRLNLKGLSHVREARMLCRKTVELFTLLSHTQETGSRRMGMTQELLALVTGLAHYLKILIRIALTGALKLEKEQNVRESMASFLDKLHLLAVQGANPAARRLIKGPNGEVMALNSMVGNFGTQAVTYGFRSLAPENAGDPPFREGSTKLSVSTPPSDLCVKCNNTVEEDCVRLGTYQRWHSHCIECARCGKVAAVSSAVREASSKIGEDKETKDGLIKDLPPKPSTARRPPANVGAFVYEVESIRETVSFGDVPTVILCMNHAHVGCRGGFQSVQRLEQYAFLLNVALRRLYLLLKKQGVVPLTPAPCPQEQTNQTITSDPYRNSADIMRLKSVHLDRKISTTARLPKRSTIVESPAGRSVHPADLLQPQKLHDSHQASPTIYAQGLQILTQQLSSSPLHSSVLSLGKTPVDSSAYPQTSTRNPAEVMIVEDSGPNSPSEGNPPVSALQDGITLADLPQIMEVARAREQRRSLPRENAIPYIAELGPLELAIVKHCAVLTLTRSPLKDQLDLDELLEMVETKKAGFWKTLFNIGDKKNIKKKGVFGVPLDLLVEREGADSVLGATRETLRVPSFIDDVISAMKQMDMSIEGIFRKNGNIRRLKDLTEAIDRDPSSVDLTQDNPVQLAALLKKYLRDLPDPLMTFKLHRLFIASQSVASDADRKRYLHMVSLILPKSHRDTMEVLFVFLKWVASFAHMDAETGSKMDLGNLATVICPSILYTRSRDAMREETFGALRVVTTLLENQDDFFTVPQEFLGILSNRDYFSGCLELPGKEFLKKCDAYLKVKGSNGRLQSGASHNSQNYTSTSRPSPATGAERPTPTVNTQSDRNVRPLQNPNQTQPPSSSPPSTQLIFQRIQPLSDGKAGPQQHLSYSNFPRTSPETSGQLTPNSNDYS